MYCTKQSLPNLPLSVSHIMFIHVMEHKNFVWIGGKDVLSLYQSTNQSISQSVHQPVSLSIRLSVPLSVHPSIHPSNHPSIHPSIHPTTYLPTYLPTYQSINHSLSHTEIQTFISKHAQWTSVTISTRFTWETHRPRLTFVTSWTWQASRPNRSWHTWGTRWSLFTLHQATTDTVKVTGAYTQFRTSAHTLQRTL
jgi:hypothetical protein